MSNSDNKPVKINDKTVEKVSGGGLYGSEYVYAINQMLCTGCGECQKACWTTAIIKEGVKYTILPDYCWGCGNCQSACFKGAIYKTRDQAN